MWQIVVMAGATLLSGVFLWALFTGQAEFSALVEGAGNDPLRELYVAGFRLCQVLKVDFNSVKKRRRVRQSQIIHGEKYGEYYYRLLVAKQITMFLLVLIVGLCLAVVLNEVLVAGFGLIAAAGMVYYYESTIQDVVKARAKSIERDFPTIVSTLALLVNAGLIVREAWDKIGRSGEGVLYEEMRQATLKMENGTAEDEAYLEFAKRCGDEAVTKFAAALVQNLSKGNHELVLFLRQCSAERWTERKQAVRVKGEEASTKLMIPITIMMVGLMIMICVPIMSGMVL